MSEMRRRSHRLNVALFGDRLERRAGELSDREVERAYIRSLGTDALAWRANLRGAGYPLGVQDGELGVLTPAGVFR